MISDVYDTRARFQVCVSSFMSMTLRLVFRSLCDIFDAMTLGLVFRSL